MISNYILETMKEFDCYDDERLLFDEIRVIDFTVKHTKESSFPTKAIIDRILEQVEVK
jgi:hypothetical protein